MSGVVVDTSAIVAILTGEPGGPWLAAQLRGAETRVISAPNSLEVGIVLEARVPGQVGIAGRALRDAGIDIEPFDDELAERALEAWRRFGKGRHSAALNFGDCCTYAVAARTGYPIVCTGAAFASTDLPVLRPPQA